MFKGTVKWPIKMLPSKRSTKIFKYLKTEFLKNNNRDCKQ